MIDRAETRMRNLFDMIFEYQLLRGKRDHLDVPLDDDERARFLGLGQLLTGDSRDQRRSMPRLPCPIQVQFTLPGGFESGEVKNISGLGLAIATSRPLTVGTRTVIRVLDGAVEYFFPCVVMWQRSHERSGMGLAFDGVPSRSHLFADDDTGVYRSLNLGQDTSQRQVHAA